MVVAASASSDFGRACLIQGTQSIVQRRERRLSAQISCSWAESFPSHGKLAALTADVVIKLNTSAELIRRMLRGV
jgi:hypothetical protein